jgi:hypothetical protein
MVASANDPEVKPRRGMGRAFEDLAIIETILRNRYHYFAEIRDGIALFGKLRAMLLSSIVFLALYGAVLGSTHSVWQALSSALKLPLLFLATVVVTSPTLYFFNVLFGSDQSLRQSVALILTAITVTSVILLSFTPIVLFFLLTTSQYQFLKLLHVAIFCIAGLVGVRFLNAGMRVVSTSQNEGSAARQRIVRLWVIIYGFVGSQMAWTLRPFIGAPSMPFELFRQLGGNFYSNIFASLGEFLGFFMVK